MLSLSAVFRAARLFAFCFATLFAGLAAAQGVSTTTIQGSVYLANGQPGSGTLQISWPAFTTANNLAVAAGRTTVPIPADGFVSVNLAPNLGASPAGLFYTAVYHMSDGTTSTEYWVVPAAAQAALSSVRAQVMPAAQAVQAVSKAYVDQAIQSLATGSLTPVGGTLSGPLYLSGDPTQALQAADKHYVDSSVAQSLPLSGGAATGPLTATQLGAAFQVDQFPGADFGAQLQACINGLSTMYGGTCDARNFSGSLSMAANVNISTANATILLPCATITTSSQIVVTAGTRNVSLRGCSLRGASTASGSQGGTVFMYTGSVAMIQVGDPTYAADTQGFHLENVVLNTTGSSSSAAQPFIAFRTQELSLQGLYLLGNANQTGLTLDGTGNYTGGSVYDTSISGFLTALNAIGHRSANAATTDWMNASTFVRLHINCPTSNGSPTSGTTGINLAQGDGNTFTGGDVEGCATALHLGVNAQNNTLVGLRNENSTNQVVADTGSSYNNWITGGTMFTGELMDNGTHNSFWDSFHRTMNGIKGDWYASQQDATVTDHERLGTGLGTERGRVTEYQTDYGYRWTTGLGDGTTGAQFYNITDLLNNVPRLSIGQYLSAMPNSVTNVLVNNGGCYSSSAPPTISFSGGGGSGASATANMALSTSLSCAGGYNVSSVSMTANGTGYTTQPTLAFAGANQTKAPSAVAEITTAGSTNNQTVLNSAGSGAVVLNGSNNSGTGGVVFGSGGANETTVATINSAGNAQFNGSLQVGGASTFANTTTIRNSADSEIDSILQAGATANQKESFIYRDYTGASQWYMVKDANNNWALNSATGGIDSIKAYQNTNSGDTYINAANASGVVRVNYETGSGTQFKVYGGNSSTPYAAFIAANSIQFPGLAASSGHSCLQIDNSGYITNTGSACGTGSGSTNGTVNNGNSGQIAYYSATGTAVSGMNAVPVSAGGTGATTAAAAMTALGAASLAATSAQNFSGPVAAPALNGSVNSQINVMAAPYNAKGDCITDDQAAIQSAINAAGTFNPPAVVYFPKPAGGCYLTSTLTWNGASLQGQPSLGITPASGSGGVILRGKPGQDVFHAPDPSSASTNAPSKSWSIRDLVVQVDDSIDASATFAHRWPGRWFNDAAINAGSSVFTSANAQISCGDVGQNILVKGAGASGADLATTITSVAPCTGHRARTITLATAASTTVSAVAAYITPLGIPLTATIGNCALAMDNRDGNPSNWSMTGTPANAYDTLWNATFTSLSGNAQNNSCGIYTQGVWGPYGLDARNVNIARTVWGIVQGAPETNSYYQSDTGDFELWDHGNWNLVTYPWISYNGGFNSIKQIQLATTYGPQLLSLGNKWYDNLSGWTINAPEFEMNSGNTGWRIEGRQNLVENTVLSSGAGATALFDTDDTVCNNCSVGGHLVINGMQNDIRLGGDISSYTMDVADHGFGNSVTGAYNSNPQGSADPTRYTALNITRGPQPAGIQTADFVRTGNVASPYFNDLDLFFWPADFIFNGASGTVVNDSTSLTGSYFTWPNSGLASNFASLSLVDGRSSNSGNTAVISSTAGGGNVPAGNVLAYASVKCSVASTVEFDLYAGSTQIASTTPACGTTYSTISLQGNLAPYAGQNLGFRLSSTSGNPLVSWIAVRPFQTDYNGGQPVLARVALSTAGSGAAVPTGPASSTDGDITAFSGSQGQIQDSGIALAALPSLTSAAPQTFAAAIAAPSVNNITEASQYPSFAAAVAATPSGGRLHLAAGTFTIAAGGATIGNPIYIQCDPGAILQASSARTGAAITVAASSVTFDGCAVDGGDASSSPGLGTLSVNAGLSGFTFKNGSLIHFKDQGIFSVGDQNITITNNTITFDSGLTFAGGITIYSTPGYTVSNVNIANNTIYGHVGVLNQSTGGNIQNVHVTGNKVFPINGQFAVEIGDFSTGQASTLTNFDYSNNICTIQGTTASTPVFGCFSTAWRVNNLVMGPNTYNAVGQYVSIAIIELGAYDPVVGTQTINAGQDPGGSQNYSAFAIYNGGAFTGSRITGWGGLGSAYSVYAQGNGDNLSITGGSVTADSTVNNGIVNGAYSAGVRLFCNQNKVIVRVTSIGAGGAVTAVAFPYWNPSGTGSAAGGGYSAGNGVATAKVTGSGSGLTLNTTVNSSGSITAAAVNNGGSGYKVGDLIGITSTNPNYYGSSILNTEIGGGLSINGAMYRAIDVEDADGTNHCPASAHVSGITVNGAVNAAYSAGTGATLALGDVQASNVTNSAPRFDVGATPKMATFGNGVALSNLAPSSNYLCASGPNGAVTNVGCSKLPSSTFTPTATGWYRIINATSSQISGSIDIDAAAYNNHEIHDRFEFVGSGNGGNSVLNAALLSNYGGSYGPIDQVEVSSNGGNGIYVDVHIGDVTNAQPITIKYSGQSLPAAAIVTNPVAGATPGSSGAAVINIGSLSTAPQVTRKTTGQDEALNYNAISGYLVNGVAFAAANLSNGTTGTGNVVLSSGPTFKGNATTFANGAAAEQDVVLQPGSTADQVGAFALANYSGVTQWKLRKDASNYLRLTDSVNSLDRGIFYQNGQTILNAGAGSNAVVLNGTANSGTGGLLVQNGGSSPSTVLTVTGSGNATATGFIAGKSLTGSGSMSLATGGAAGSSPSLACSSSHVCDSISGTVTLTTGSSPTTGTLATLTFPSAHTNSANCIVNASSPTAQLSSITWSETASALTVTANSALNPSTAYQIRYWCGGN